MLQDGVVSMRGGPEETLFTLKLLNKEAYASILEGAIGIDFEPGIDPSAEIEEGTPLDTAAFYGNWETAMIVIEAGANVDAMTQTGRTPSDIAVKEGEEVIAWLLFSKNARFEPKDAASGIIVESNNNQRRDRCS